MDGLDGVLVTASEFIKHRLYFVTLRIKEQIKSTGSTHYFSIGETLNYESFFSDFGPLNICMLKSYCTKLNKKLSSTSLKHKKIVHTTTYFASDRVNAACLIGCYAIIYLDFTPQKAYDVLNSGNTEPFIEFRDASIGQPNHTISLIDCLNGLYRAKNLGFFNFEAFNSKHYEHYEKVEYGDLNWIVPNKFIGFCGPQSKARIQRRTEHVQQLNYLHSPDFYFNYFKSHNVTTIIRLNKKVYEASDFIDAGFDHYDLFFVDGSTPTDKILTNFLNLCEKASGAIAVHCKAGLGRTGTLIGCYLMKHYQFTAKEAIAWIRMCRPGSVIGHQQPWLEWKQEQMWKEGETYRRKLNSGPPIHTEGIYADMSDIPFEDDVQQVSGILKKVNTMKLNDKDDVKSNMEKATSPMTQGDRLNQIKVLRKHTRPLAVRPNNERKVFRARVLVSPVGTPTILRAGKLTPVSVPVKTPTSSTSRVLSTKRTEDRYLQQQQASVTAQARRVSQRVTKQISQTRKENGWHLTSHDGPPSNLYDNAAERKELKLLKRGKRSLASTDREKLTATAVKLLRRSHPIVGNNIDQNKIQTRPKITLPVVKHNKTL